MDNKKLTRKEVISIIYLCVIVLALVSGLVWKLTIFLKL